jgi:hypothetical protein
MHDNLTAMPTDVVELKGNNLSGTQSKSGEQKQYGMVASTDWCLEIWP